VPVLHRALGLEVQPATLGERPVVVVLVRAHDERNALEVVAETFTAPDGAAVAVWSWRQNCSAQRGP
jgi:hypothetical protein